MKRIVILVGLLSILTGCAVGPDYQRPDLSVPVPEAWSRDLPRTALADDGASRWWEDFGDDGLNELVERALTGNQDLAAAAARVQEARALVGGSQAQRWPTLEIGAAASRSKNANLGMPGFIDPHQSVFSGSATARWELDLWGRLSRGKEAAVAGLLASENDRRALAQSLVAEVVRAWLEAHELDQQLELTRRSIASYSSTLQTVEDRYQGGLVPALDMHLARQNLAVAQAVEPAQQQARAVIGRRLAILAGGYPDAASPAPQAPVADLPGIPEGLPSTLLERRPDLGAAEMRLHASVAQIGQAKALLYPRISLTAGGGSTSGELADLGKDGTDVWSLAGNLVMPLINRGATVAQIRAAEARAAAAVAGYRQAILMAFAEVENALDQDHFQQLSSDQLGRAAESARYAEELSRDRYQRGLDNLLVLLESQRRLYNTESQRLTAERQRRTARVNLILALGGPWDLTGDSARADLDTNGSNQGVQQ